MWWQLTYKDSKSNHNAVFIESLSPSPYGFSILIIINGLGLRRINPYGRGFRYPILIDVANEAGIISSYFVVKKSFGHEKNKKAVIPLKAIPILGVDLLNQWLPLLIRGLFD